MFAIIYPQNSPLWYGCEKCKFAYTNIVKSKQIDFSFLLVVTGALLFVLVGVVAIWGDIKSISFDNQRLATDPLRTLQCPVLITANENGSISALIVNETKKDVSIPIKAVITNGSSGDIQTIESEIPLGSYESQILTWPINALNAAADQFILVRVHQMVYSSNPYLNASCGVFVANIPFLTGAQLILIIMGLATLFSGAGLFIWGLSSTPRGWQDPGFKRWVFFLVIALLLALVALSGYWGAALFIAIIWIMQVVELILYFGSQKKTVSQES